MNDRCVLQWAFESRPSGVARYWHRWSDGRYSWIDHAFVFGEVSVIGMSSQMREDNPPSNLTWNDTSRSKP